MKLVAAQECNNLVCWGFSCCEEFLFWVFGGQKLLENVSFAGFLCAIINREFFGLNSPRLIFLVNFNSSKIILKFSQSWIFVHNYIRNLAWKSINVKLSFIPVQKALKNFTENQQILRFSKTLHIKNHQTLHFNS
jgi:hypothetical protein